MEPARKDTSIIDQSSHSWKVTMSMTSARSKWIALLIEAGVVTAWSLWTFADRSTDEVSSAALVVMITFVVWGEVLRLTCLPIGGWIRTNVRVEVNQPPPDRANVIFASVLAWALVGAVVTFLFCEAYGTSFLIASQMFPAFGLAWAYHQTFVFGARLVAIGAVILLIGIVIVILGLFAFASVASWPLIQARFTRYSAGWVRFLFASFAAPII
jgi:hypothetical protein